ncbi:potassium channel family protein [Aestuariibacter sp. AA17]|uniref:Potassium channel family protein n=1 Tax=Fluctibacter corallii TaxID=2984329 RepID=A0ABT3ACB0_9ALTE|nr:potassium channel family protein [Aestuariibacter sp. AA17]MCV2886269.1 potassium channel family protein [Aestuariibacter sp. AA17]
MLLQLGIGTIAITTTTVIQVVFMAMLARFFQFQTGWTVQVPFPVKFTIVMVASVLWLVLGITVSTWGWATIYLKIDAFDHWEPALYFAISSFTTLGYGDVVLDEKWRILGALSAVNGMIVFGLNTAFLMEQIIRCNKEDDANS